MTTNGTPRGFAGLVQHVSSDAIPPPRATPPVAAPAPPKSSAPTAAHVSPMLDKRGVKRGLMIWGGVILFLVVTLVIVASRSGGDATGPTPSEPDSTTSQGVMPTAPEPAPTPTPMPMAPVSDFVETQPPVGSANVLGRDELRYCLSEHIRLDSWATQVDKDSKTAVAAFNASIDDYNSRCAHYKYRQGALDSVRAEVDDSRTRLVQEGIARAAEHR